MENSSKRKVKLGVEVRQAIKDEVDKNIISFRKDLVSDFQNLLKTEIDTSLKRNKEVEDSIELYLEHYISLKEYIESEEKNNTKEYIDDVTDSLFNDLMTTGADSHERNNSFQNIFQNFKKTKTLYDFLTKSFNDYIKDNIKFKDKCVFEDNGKPRRNMELYRKYRTVVLLQEHYMEGKRLDELEIYSSDDVYKTYTSEYQRQFVVDKRALIKNLAPLLFGIDGIDILRKWEKWIYFIFIYILQFLFLCF